MNEKALKVIADWIQDAASGHVKNAGMLLTPANTQLVISVLQAVAGDIAELDTPKGEQKDLDSQSTPRL